MRINALRRVFSGGWLLNSSDSAINCTIISATGIFNTLGGCNLSNYDAMTITAGTLAIFPHIRLLVKKMEVHQIRFVLMPVKWLILLI